MAAIGFKGIDVRQTVDRLLFEALLVGSSGDKVVSGTTDLYLYEVQDDGILKSYDWNDNTFKTTALTTEKSSLTHRTGNNSTTNTGLWTKTLTTLTGFTIGAIYIVETYNSGAAPLWQARKFQFGSCEGDDGAFAEFTVGASSTTTSVRSNRTEANDFWINAVIAFTTGTYRGLGRKVSAYANTNGAFTVSALPGAPASGDRGIIVGVIE